MGGAAGGAEGRSATLTGMARPDLLSHGARQQRWADLALLAVAGAWGATFVMVKDALAEVGPLTFVALRFALGAAAMLPFLRAGWVGETSADSSWARRGAPLARAGVLAGICLFAGYAFQTAGLQFTGAGRAGFITGLSVVIVPIVSALARRHPVGRAAAFGVGLATCGLALLSADALGAEPWSVSVGDLLVFGCAWAFALHILALGRFAPEYGAVGLAFVQILAVALLSAAAAAIWEQPTWHELVAATPAAAFTGLICTGLAFAVQTHAQRFTTPTHTALIFSAEPVFAAAFAYLVAGERLGGPELLGCGLILLGMLVVQLAPGDAR